MTNTDPTKNTTQKTKKMTNIDPTNAGVNPGTHERWAVSCKSPVMLIIVKVKVLSVIEERKIYTHV